MLLLVARLLLGLHVLGLLQKACFRLAGQLAQMLLRVVVEVGRVLLGAGGLAELLVFHWVCCENKVSLNK